jgi:hypothetical protein
VNAIARLRWLRPVLAALLAAAAIFSLAWLLPWTYAPPPGLTTAEAQARITEPQAYQWHPGIRLLGTEIESRLRPGAAQPEVIVSACWQTDKPLDRNYTVFMHVLDADLNILGGRNTHPGLGNLPTTLWQPGEVYCEQYRMPVDQLGVTEAQTGRIDIGFYDQDPAARLPVTAGDLSPEGLVYIGEVEVPPLRAPGLGEP